MACHKHKPKLKRRCVLHKCIQTWRTPAVAFWTLEIALSSSDDKRIIRPDKIQSLAHGYRTGWHEKPTREPTGVAWQSNRATGEPTGWHGRPGKVTGEVIGWQGWQQGDRGGLAKWGKMNKCPLLSSISELTKSAHFGKGQQRCLCWEVTWAGLINCGQIFAEDFCEPSCAMSSKDWL